MAPTTLTPPPGWDLTGDPNNPAYRSPTITLPNAPTGFGRSIGINVAATTGTTGVYYRDLDGDDLIGTLSSDGKTFDLTPKGRSYLQRAYTTIPAGTFNTNAKAQSWLNANLLPVVNNQRATFLNASYKSYTGNYNSNLSSVPGFAGNAPQSGTSQTQVQPAPSTGAGIFNLQQNVSGITTQFGQIQFKKGQTFQYPKDATYSGKNAQDHLTISKYSYKAPYGDVIFQKDKTGEILTNGLTRGSALKEFLGMVIMPMPNSISDSNNVSWADDNMNNLTAAATNKVASDIGGTAAFGIAGGLIGLISQLLTGSGSAGGGASAGVASKIYLQLMKDAVNSGQNGQTIGGAAGASKLLSMAGFSVSPESILARGAGIIPNSNLELLFNSPTLREFTFQYRMSPRGEDEAKMINNIIRFFKQGMAAKKQEGRSGAASYFLGTPDVFQLSYRTKDDSMIKGVNRIKTCALVGFSMNYTADGTWAAYDDGQPVSVIANMSFKELEPIYDTDYQENIFDKNRNYDFTKNSTGDLYPISEEDVGY
jgi:hypothetical protein